MDAELTPGEIRTEDDADTIQPGDAILATPVAAPLPSLLDRVIPLGAATTWQTVGWVVALLTALALRLVQLKGWALGPDEAARAYDAWVLFRGQPPVGGVIPETSPLLLLLEGSGFFLFGATDVIARLIPVLAGLAIVALPLALRRWVGGPAALGMAALAAISPTLVYASRVISPEIVVAALALAAVACLVRLGDIGASRSSRSPAIALGIVAGAAYAAGPSAVTVALTLAVGLTLAAVTVPEGLVRRGLGALRGQIPAFLLAAAVTAIVLFTPIFSDPGGIAGIGQTVAEWWGLLATESSGQPVQLFLLALLIYEPVAIVFAVAALARDSRQDATPLFAGWAAAAFAIWSFSAGREPLEAVHVALPVVLLGGLALGNTLHAIAWEQVWHGRGGLLALAFLGIVVGLAAVGVLLRRVNAAADVFTGALPPVAVLCLVVVPLAYLAWRLIGDERREAGDARQSALVALLVAAVLLGAFGLRSAALLAQDRAAVGTELLAQRTATLGTLPRIEGLLRLARDVGVDSGTARDPTGSHGLSIALERDVAWPYLWYFREFPEVQVVAAGSGAGTGAQVVVAASDDGLSDSGYGVQTWPWLNMVPPAYQHPDMGAIARAVIDPARWLEVWRYLLFREGVAAPEPATVAVGLTPELAARVTVRSGPYDLGDRPGPGTEPGQFTDPIGVAVGPDGGVAVVDSGNARVERFAADGRFLGAWGEDEGGVTFTRTENGLGPTGIAITPDGTTWVADTWGHRVVALDANGTVVQTIGGETVDTGDDPARVDQDGGRFFGPRDVAVSDAAIYVVDTGNERIQQFTRDGQFVTAWGGYGTAPGQLIEPVGIAIGPDGNLYVADSGNARISIFTPTGQAVAQWPVSAWPPPNPGGLPPAFQPYLAFDTAGNLYATASNAGEALVFDSAGAEIAQITEAGGEQMAQPIGVAVAPGGDVLFTDIGRDAVLEYTPPPAFGSPAPAVGNAVASPVP